MQQFCLFECVKNIYVEVKLIDACEKRVNVIVVSVDICFRIGKFGDVTGEMFPSGSIIQIQCIVFITVFLIPNCS